MNARRASDEMPKVATTEQLVARFTAVLEDGHIPESWIEDHRIAVEFAHVMTMGLAKFPTEVGKHIIEDALEDMVRDGVASDTVTSGIYH